MSEKSLQSWEGIETSLIEHILVAKYTLPPAILVGDSREYKVVAPTELEVYKVFGQFCQIYAGRLVISDVLRSISDFANEVTPVKDPLMSSMGELRLEKIRGELYRLHLTSGNRVMVLYKNHNLHKTRIYFCVDFSDVKHVREILKCRAVKV